MQKQVWVYLTEADERALLSELCGRFPLRLVGGRFFQGDVDADAPLLTRPLRRTEHCTFLIHREHSRELVWEELTDGPFAGWRRLDDVRSEVIALVRPEPEQQGLGPARVAASTHAWFGGKRLRKSHEFGRFVNEVLDVVQRYPATAFDWLHVAPEAARMALEGRPLHYLYKPVPLAAQQATPVTRPHQGR